MKKIVFATLRDNKGATGGPGGVLYLNKTIIGKSINNQTKCFYWFNKYQSNSIKHYKLINKIVFTFKSLLSFKTLFVVHDIDAAFILSKLKKKYILVYHQQGPLLREYSNFGVVLSKKKANTISKIERKAFISAQKIHFPSIGAKKMYFEDNLASCSINEVTCGEPLYNTIPEIIISNNNIEIDNCFDGITLFSLGTLTEAKGQDRVVDFLEEFLSLTNKRIRYIIVGDGPLRNTVINKCEDLKVKNNNFYYIYFPKLSHEKVMSIHFISDIYIMLHRLSIFDFATLEAMNNNCAIVLSSIGGNQDFNKNDNIIYIDNPKSDARKLLNINIEQLKKKNKEVFCSYFSNYAFKERYIKTIFEQQKNDKS